MALVTALSACNSNQKSSQTTEDTKSSFDVPHRIEGIAPGKSTLADVLDKFNEADSIEYRYAHNEAVYQYLSRGISFVFYIDQIEKLQNNAQVDAVYINEKYSETSVEGVYMGMSSEKLLSILSQELILDDSINLFGKYFFLDEDTKNTVAFANFKNDKLFLLGIFPPNREER